MEEHRSAQWHYRVYHMLLSCLLVPPPPPLNQQPNPLLPLPRLEVQAATGGGIEEIIADEVAPVLVATADELRELCAILLQRIAELSEGLRRAESRNGEPAANFK